MDIHHSLTAEHEQVRTMIQTLRAQRPLPSPDVKTLLEEMKTFIRRLFLREEVYYRAIDKDVRFSNPGFVHQLRNDHAALLFGMESLLIRLKKKGPVAEWWDHFEKLMSVFLPHMKQEEDALFPEAERLLTAAEWETIRQNLAAL